jgi:molybdopterin/thiamine biosynthesis adenylyltransferase/rhodanese-related sulfurtransferase
VENTAFEAEPADISIDDFDLLIDLRPHARTSPSIAGSIVVDLDDLIADPTRWIPTPASRSLIICDIGQRSAIAAEHLQAAGYSAAVSLAGGIDAWRHEGLALADTAGLTAAQLERYDRHLKLAQVGVPGQRALLDATVAVVGAGGLGSPVIMYLAAAGVGTIMIIDDDDVDTSNLQRQPIHSAHDVGTPKASSASRFVSDLNPDVTIVQIRDRLGAANASDLLHGATVIVDASDNFATRYAINDAAVKLGVPVVFASVYAMEGQVAVFDAVHGPCYRCVFPEQPAGSIPLDCTTIGVLGSITGVLGSLQATEAIKLIVGSDGTLTGRLLLYDAATQSFTTLRVQKDPTCVACSSGFGVDTADISPVSAPKP